MLLSGFQLAISQSSVMRISYHLGKASAQETDSPHISLKLFVVSCARTVLLQEPGLSAIVYYLTILIYACALLQERENLVWLA